MIQFSWESTEQYGIGLKKLYLGVTPPQRGAYNNQKKLKFRESALFSGL